MDKEITKKSDSEENSPLLTKITYGKEDYKRLRNVTEDPVSSPALWRKSELSGGD